MSHDQEISIDTAIKEYFKDDVATRACPPFPQVHRSFKWETLCLAACAAFCVLTISMPALYDNPLRRAYIPMSRYEAVKEAIPRVIFDASIYFKDKARSQND